MKIKLLLTLTLIVLLITSLEAQPANDDCANAEFITVTTLLQSITFDLTDAVVNSESGCAGDGLADYIDVWYEFIMPTSGNLYINGGVSVNKFNIYDSCNGNELTCFSTNEYVENLIQGNTYVLRVHRWLPQHTENNQSFSIYALQPLTNDSCVDSTNITVGETLQTIDFNIVEAEINNEIGCDGESLDDFKDIWYNFTMPVDGILEMSSGTNNRFSIYDSCNGNQIVCFDGNFNNTPFIIDNLTQNENYTLRVFRSNLNSSINQFFTIRYIEPTYPNCNNVETITVTTDLQTIDIGLDNTTYNYEFGCDENDLDQFGNYWYEFTMPVNGNLYIKTSIRNRLAILDSCDGTVLKCFDSSMENMEDELFFLNKVIEDLVQGQTYTLRIYRPINTPSTIFDEQFDIRAFERLSNDNCATPDIISGLTSENTQIPFFLKAGNVTTDDTCEGESDFRILEAFWQVTMPITGNLFIDTPNGNGIAVYDACSGNELFCNASEGSLESFKLISNLIEGDTYIIRCFNTERGLISDSFQSLNVRVYNRAANDECIDAEVIPSITEVSQEISFDTFGSLINLEESCSGFIPENFVDVWYEFTMPDFTYLNFESYQFNFFSIYDACNGNETHCFAGFESVENLVPNQTYILRVFQRQTEMFHPNKSFNIYGSNTVLSLEDFNASSITLYPNPTTNYITIDTKAIVETVEIYSISGKRVLQTSQTQNISTQQLEKGIYIIKIQTDYGQITKRMIKR